MTDEENATESTTFTFRPETREWLRETYPDSIGLNEAIRSAISDARLVREGCITKSKEQEEEG